jgi:small ligand-binding sensory domain FIST
MSHASAADVRTPLAASAISGHFDTRTAATEVASTLFDDLAGGSSTGGPGEAWCDLLLMFGSFHHRAAFDDAADIMRKTLRPGAMLGVTAEAVIGRDRELEGVAGLSAIALRLPGVRIHSWRSTPDDPIPLLDPNPLPPDREPIPPDELERMRERNRQHIRGRIDCGPDFRAAIMLADPFTTPIARLLPALTSCGENNQPVIIVGGMASGASQPGFNVLVQNDKVLSSGGAVGVSISGPPGSVEFDFIVSQGCRPLGKPFVITKCRQNVIIELGGRKAIEVLQEQAQELPDSEKRLLSKGLLIGTVINEYKDRFGRGDFLVRNVIGLDQKAGGIAVGEMCRAGQTVQFHVRDAATAAEDLQLLLDSQAMHESPPLGALLFSCNGRGERLFGQPNHDLNIIRARLGEIPIAGFFAAGEFGPIGNRSFLHGHTASLAVIRAKA